MAEEAQYGAPDAGNNKRKYDDQAAPSPGPRRPTGFSAPIASLSSPDGAAPPSSYNNVPPPMDDFQLAKQKAQEIAARLLNSAEAKKPRVDNHGGGAGGYDSYERKGSELFLTFCCYGFCVFFSLSVFFFGHEVEIFF